MWILIAIIVVLCVAWYVREYTTTTKVVAVTQKSLKLALEQGLLNDKRVSTGSYYVPNLQAIDPDPIYGGVLVYVNQGDTGPIFKVSHMNVPTQIGDSVQGRVVVQIPIFPFVITKDIAVLVPMPHYTTSTPGGQ